MLNISLHNHMVIPPFSREFLVGTYIYIYLYNVYIYIHHLRSHLLDNVCSAPPSPFQKPKKDLIKNPPASHPIRSIHLKHLRIHFCIIENPTTPGFHSGPVENGSRYQLMAQWPRKRYGNMSDTSAVCLFFKEQP